MFNYKKSLKVFSRHLRTEMTEAEKLLWSKIRRRQLQGYQFNRQKPIGDFIVDFHCAKAKLVIELDGGQHYTDEGKAKDLIRDEYMKSLGLRVLRFSDTEVFENMDGLIQRIMEEL